jgi:hypothetical protein
LDRQVFGVLNVYAGELWRKQYHDSGGAKTPCRVIAANLVAAWERIVPDVLEYAWASLGWIGDWQDVMIGTDNTEYQMTMTVEGQGNRIQTPRRPT